MRAVCVYCGSSTGSDPRYVDTARELGRLLARRGVTLVYGGASVGTMGAIADAALVAGGRVHGVITRQLVDVEIAHAGLTTLDVMGSMHERKARLAELADGFIGLPGGLGTLDELFEMLTWSQLGLHRKPVGMLDDAGYWDHLLAFLDHAVGEGFLSPEHRDLVLRETHPGELLERLDSWVPPAVPKWVDPPPSIMDS